jgi:hypothetical protein
MLGVMDRSTAEVAALEQALRERWSGWDAPGFMAYMDRVLGTSGGEEAPGTPVASANTATTRVLARVKEDS